MFVWKRPKIHEKEAGVGPFFYFLLVFTLVECKMWVFSYLILWAHFILIKFVAPNASLKKPPSCEGLRLNLEKCQSEQVGDQQSKVGSRCVLKTFVRNLRLRDVIKTFKCDVDLRLVNSTRAVLFWETVAAKCDQICRNLTTLAKILNCFDLWLCFMILV